MRTPVAGTRRRPGVLKAQRWKLALGTVVLGAAVYFFLGEEGGLVQVWHKRRELEVLELRVAQLQTENDSLKQVLWRLENDLEYVEKVAREEYGMIKPGERLYRLRTPPAGN